jgi:hypothetical protein
MAILAQIAGGDMPEERMGKEGPYQVPTSNRDRMAAIKMMFELDGAFERAKKETAAKGDAFASMSERQLRMAFEHGDENDEAADGGVHGTGD